MRSLFFFKGGEAMPFLTINQTAKSENLPHTVLRRRLAEHRLPGFYAGTRYYVNLDLLREMLDEESRASMEQHNKSA